MVFKNEEHLERILLQKCQVAIAKAEQKIYGIIKRVLAGYYGEFNPEYYIRTEQLLHSLVKSQVKKEGKGYVAEVYFDSSLINYENGWIPIKKPLYLDEAIGYATWGAEEVYDTALSKGTHGGYKSGTAVWGKSHEEFASQFGTIYDLLIKELKKQGVPIR